MSRPLPFTRDEIIGATGASFSRSCKVRFQDVDAAGTVFFPRIVEYFADVYLACLDARGVDLAETLRSRAWAIPLTHVEADFLAPMRFGDAFEVEIVGARFGGSSFTLAYRARTPDGARVLAIGQTVHVVVDGTTFRPMPVPQAIAEALRSASV